MMIKLKPYRTGISTVVLITGFKELYIGRLEHSGAGTFISTPRIAKKHLLLKFNALGINYELFQTKQFDKIIIPYEGKDLKSTKEQFRKSGKIIKWKGVEEQIFLPLEYFSGYIPPLIQQELFEEKN